jgi:predicted deacylase
VSDAPSATTQPVDLLPIDITAYTGNTEVQYVTTLDSENSGPHVLVNALTHGNEICGAYALDYLFRNEVTPVRGKLSLSFANIDAYETFYAANPSASRYLDEDFNRLWAAGILEAPTRSREHERAKTLRPLIDEIDHILDLHSMQPPSPALALAGTTEKCLATCMAIGVPAAVVVDTGHAAGVRLRDYHPFVDLASKRSAVLIECGQHWATHSRDVAIDATLRFLLALGTVDANSIAPKLSTTPPPQHVINVSDAITVLNNDFHFLDDYAGLEVIAEAGTAIARDGTRPVVTAYDDCVLIMPTRRIKRGQTAVRFGRYRP